MMNNKTMLMIKNFLTKATHVYKLGFNMTIQYLNYAVLWFKYYYNRLVTRSNVEDRILLKMSRVSRRFITKLNYSFWYSNRLRYEILYRYNFINSIIPLIFSFTVMVSSNLELEFIVPSFLEMNSLDPTLSSFSVGSTSVIDLTGDDNQNIEKPWMDLKLIKQKDNICVVDNVQKEGVNLIEKLEAKAGQGKPELVSVRSGNVRCKGLQLDIDSSTPFSSMSYQGKIYQGHYVDLKFSNATVTSSTIPIQKNETGHIFIIWRKFGK